jgi:hypothetical protein
VMDGEVGDLPFAERASHVLKNQIARPGCSWG